MTLTECFLELVHKWSRCFKQKRTFQRGVMFAFTSLLVIGRACISRMICLKRKDQVDWSADYRFFARSEWNPQDLMDQSLRELIDMYHGDIVIAFDDTKIPKTGKTIETASFHRDPMSPPFHVNLIWGLRFLHAAFLVPLHKQGNQPARAVPILFQEVPVVKKPRHKATEEEWAVYERAKQKHNLSTAFVDALRHLRETLDRLGAASGRLIAVVDGSFCNRVCMTHGIDRVVIVGRPRKDAKLCFAASTRSI